MDKQIKEQFENERKNYYSLRDVLLKEHPSKWVAISGGKMVACGEDPKRVLREAYQNGYKVIYLNKIGEEEKLEAVIRVKKSWKYDTSYPLFPMPKVPAMFSDIGKTQSKFYPGSLVDSGSDVSVIPYRDCIEIGINNSPVLEIPVRWVERASVERKFLYLALVEISGFKTEAIVDADEHTTESILGRDVLNEFKVILDGQKREVTISDYGR